MSAFWVGFLVAFGVVLTFPLIALFVLAVVAVFGKSQTCEQSCGFCGKSWDCPNLWLEWTRGRACTRHIKREHPVEHAEFRAKWDEAQS